MMIINLKMNVVFNDMLTFKTWSRLKYLNLVGFSPDSRNTKLLRLFRNLKTLIVDYHFIDEYFFSFLPHELETLKIAERNVLVDSTYDTDTPKCNLDLESLKDNRNLKTLNLNKEISRISAVFNFLPESLETLQVTWFFLNDACRVKILTKKIALKQLVLCVNTEEKSSFIDRNPFTRQYCSLFDYFRNFIDFESLIELTLEVNGEQINLDTKTYRIK